MVANLLTQDIIMIADAVTTDVELDVASVEIIAVSGSFSCYSSVAVWAATVVVATMVVITAASGLFSYYSSVVAWDATVVVAAIADANSLIQAGKFSFPRLNHFLIFD